MANTMQSLWYDHYQGAVYPLDLRAEPNYGCNKSRKVKSLVEICGEYIVRDSSMTQQAVSFLPSSLFIPMMQEALFSNRDRAMEVLLANWPYESLTLRNLAPEVFTSLLPLYNPSYLSDIVRQGLRYTTALGHTFIESLKKRTPSKLKYLDMTGYPTAEIILYYLATHCMLAHTEQRQNLMVDMYNRAMQQTEQETEELPQHLLEITHSLPEDCCVFIKLDAFVTSETTLAELCKALKISSFQDRKIRLCLKRLGATCLGEARINLLLQLLDPQYLTGLQLKYNSLNCEDFVKLCPILKTLVNLTCLDLSCNNIYVFQHDQACDAMASAFQHLTSLTRLDLSNNRIKTKLRRILCTLHQPLRYLRLAACGLAANDLAYLSVSHHMQALEELDLSENSLRSFCRNLSQVLKAASATLLVLELEDCGFDDENIAFLQGHICQSAALMYLNVAENGVTASVLFDFGRAIARLPCLRVFKTSYPKECYQHDTELREDTEKAEAVSRLNEAVNCCQRDQQDKKKIQLVIVELERVLDNLL